MIGNNDDDDDDDDHGDDDDDESCRRWRRWNQAATRCLQSGGQRVKRSGSSSDQAFSRDESPNRMRHNRGLNRENSRESVLDERRKSRREQNDDTGDRDDSPGRWEKAILTGWPIGW